MKKFILVAAVIFLFAGNALAVPTIDGAIIGAEWSSGLILNGFDPDEGAIPNTHDIYRVAMIEETGGAGNGLYLLVALYGVPTFTAAPVLTDGLVIYGTRFDLNLDGDSTDAIDRYVTYSGPATGTISVYNGLGVAVGGAPTASMGSVVEMYVPSAMFGTFPTGGFNTFTFLDNGGEPVDDFIPDSGFNTTIPEPTSVSLLGLGLLSLIGGLVRRRKVTA